jgi:hypothetical protein
MKRILLALAVVLVLCMVLAVPAMAADPSAGSKTWLLYSTTQNDKWGNPELFMSTSMTPSGFVTVPAGTSTMWIADQVALANVTYPNDAWVVRFGTDADWGGGFTSMPNFDAKIGYWNGIVFTVLPMVTTPVFHAGYYEMEFQSVPAVGQTIPADTYLAVKLTNHSNSNHPIYTGKWIPDTAPNSQYFSCVASPQSDPGYPLPELATGILLGAGVLGLGGFMLVRRKKAAHTA